MKRIPLLLASAAIAMAATGVIATAQGTPEAPADAPRGPAAMLLERFDADGDGQVTRAEVEAEQAARFARADTDGDGALSAEELAAAEEARRMDRQAARVARMIDRFDTDGDGLLSPGEMTADAPRGDMFDRLDSDGDGTITQAELDQMRDHGRDRNRDHGHSHGDRDHGPKRGKHGGWWGRG